MHDKKDRPDQISSIKFGCFEIVETQQTCESKNCEIYIRVKSIPSTRNTDCTLQSACEKFKMYQKHRAFQLFHLARSIHQCWKLLQQASRKSQNLILIFQNSFSPNSLLLGFSMLSQYVCFVWTGVSALLSSALSLSLSPIFSSSSTGMLCLPPWTCLPACRGCCLPAGLGCCVRLLGLFSQLCNFCNCFRSAVV